MGKEVKTKRAKTLRIAKRVRPFKPGGVLSLVALACRTETSHLALMEGNREAFYAEVSQRMDRAATVQAVLDGEYGVA